MGSLPETAGEGKVIADAWDFKGRPAVKYQTGGWTSAAMILGVELVERMTTLGIAVNLVTYLTSTMHLGNAASANTVTNFLGTSFMLCLLGGIVADTYLGRYLTIAIFTAVQASGVTILTISTATPGLRPPACENPESGGCVVANGLQMGVLYLGLYLTALGTGGIKSSVSGFGSDQFDEGDETEKKQMMRFFSWFFFFINIGTLLAVTVLVYIQDHIGRRWGYGICAVAIVTGLTVFLSGTGRYRFKKLVGSPLAQIASVLVAAWRKRSADLPDPASLYDIDDAVDDGECGADESAKKKQKLPHTDDFRFLDRAAIKMEGDLAATRNKWRLCTLTDVEEVKQVIRMLPTWATTILFWTVYAQMTTFSVSQASAMDRHIGRSFEIPAGSLTVFFVLGILLTVPIYDRIMVPIFRRLTRQPQGLTPLQRIGVGLALSIVAMCAAALNERKRLRIVASGAAPVTVFWLVPQFLLVGAGEAFTYIGQLDFFLRECPKGMKTMSTGLFLSTLSLGFFISSTLVTIVHKVTGDSGKGAWLPDNLNKGKLYNFYWLLAILSVVNMAVFMAISRRYVYKEKRLAEAGVELTEEICIHA